MSRSLFARTPTRQQLDTRELPGSFNVVHLEGAAITAETFFGRQLGKACCLCFPSKLCQVAFRRDPFPKGTFVAAATSTAPGLMRRLWHLAPAGSNHCPSQQLQKQRDQEIRGIRKTSAR